MRCQRWNGKFSVSLGSGERLWMRGRAFCDPCQGISCDEDVERHDRIEIEAATEIMGMNPGAEVDTSFLRDHRDAEIEVTVIKTSDQFPCSLAFHWKRPQLVGRCGSVQLCSKRSQRLRPIDIRDELRLHGSQALVR